MDNRGIGSYQFLCLTLSAGLTMASGCAPQNDQKEELTKNLVQAGNLKLARSIGDSKHQFAILGGAEFDARVTHGDLDSSNPNRRHSDTKSLLFGLPKSMLNTPMLFGSVVTQVSDRVSEDLGGLKMADIPPFQVIPVASSDSDQKSVVSLRNCESDCSKATDKDSLIDIPVEGEDSDNIYLDLASLGKELDLTAIRKGDPTLQKFKSVLSETVKFDYSLGTLVFDIEAHLVDISASDLTDSVAETVITNRWYLKPEDTFNPKFTSRQSTIGVGFFMTEKSDVPLIQRWDFDLSTANDGIKYYIKHVPADFKPVFSSSFDEWNEKLLPIVGKKIFSYEFIPEDDIRNELMVAGDVRYNILEWDLVNKAGYGGLGPSLANQYSGEIFHANVLVQGPTIIDIYSKWFKVGQRIGTLKAEGRFEEADSLLSKYSKETRMQVQKLNDRAFEMHLGQNLKMQIRSQQPSLEDPILTHEAFDLPPEGYTYETYMAGYFHDMITHELGHNLGLRHNFRGNFGAAESSHLVSRSVMEYLGRGFRYLDHVGEYDLMAISYGYKGILPSHTNWYCTDEDVAHLNDSTKSAECSRDDATTDPFSFFQSRLIRAIDLLIARGRVSSPEWTVDQDMKGQLSIALKGMGTYAISAEKTSSTWTNFFLLPGRPTQALDVKNYVLKQIKSSICSPELNIELDRKDSLDSKHMAEVNLEKLRLATADILKSVFTSEELACASPLI